MKPLYCEPVSDLSLPAASRITGRKGIDRAVHAEKVRRAIGAGSMKARSRFVWVRQLPSPPVLHPIETACRVRPYGHCTVRIGCLIGSCLDLIRRIHFTLHCGRNPVLRPLNVATIPRACGLRQFNDQPLLDRLPAADLRADWAKLTLWRFVIRLRMFVRYT